MPELCNISSRSSDAEENNLLAVGFKYAIGCVIKRPRVPHGPLPELRDISSLTCQSREIIFLLDVLV